MLSSYLSVLRGKINRCSCVYVFKYIVKWQPVSRKNKFICLHNYTWCCHLDSWNCEEKATDAVVYYHSINGSKYYTTHPLLLFKATHHTAAGFSCKKKHESQWHQFKTLIHSNQPKAKTNYQERQHRTVLIVLERLVTLCPFTRTYHSISC